ncbi:hypothetical protein [Thioclava electrotropha]|uniref:O-antigen polymerase n=1 Tax=Thioclava electrotropha TaxID=1549850 RepID=A0ABX6YQQ8_9RHOB|nr:hypothetical protein [Thioclava electrotropha]QPZ90008.1 hypothetical protein AKL02_003295 [Thioclava electrotropha]
MVGILIPVALLSEFYYIPVFGGTLRPAHLLAPVVVLIFLPYVSRLFAAPLFWILLGLLFVNLVSALASSTPAAAFTSLLLLFANASIGIATAVLLASGRIDIPKVHALVLFAIYTSVIWSIVQVASFSLGGLNLGLSEQQIGQISAGFAPAFRTEANGFAKFLNTAFLLTFPAVLKLKSKQAFATYAVFIGIGFMLSFTRSVLYTLPITLLLAYGWSKFSGLGRTASRRPVTTGAVFALAVFIFVTQAQSFNKYAAHKISTFFSVKEILTGESSGLRLEWQQALINAFTSSNHNFLFGTGWGQVYYYYNDVAMQAGGADIIVFATYGGIFSAIGYFVFIASALFYTARMSKRTKGTRDSYYYQGILFAVLGVTVTGMINGSLNAPEYWIVMGLAIHTSARARLMSRTRASRVPLTGLQTPSEIAPVAR